MRVILVPAFAGFLFGCMAVPDDGSDRASDVGVGTYRVAPDFEAYLCASPDSGCAVRTAKSYWEVGALTLRWRTYLGDTLWCRGGGALERRENRLIVRTLGDTCLVLDDDDVLRPDSLYTLEQDSVRYYVSEVEAGGFRAKPTINSPWITLTKE